MILNSKALSKLESTFLIVIIILLFFAGYAWFTRQAPPTLPTPTSIKIVDSAGRYVEVPYPLERIACLTSESAMALVALGVKDSIVGITKYAVGEPWAPNVTNIGSCFHPNIEAIVASNPQAVITYARWPKPEDLEQRLPENIKVIRLDLYKPESLFVNFKTLGLLVNKTSRAEDLVTYYEQILNDIKSRVKSIKPEERVRIYFEGYHDYKVAGPGSGWDELLRLAGGLNVYADAPITYPNVSPEDVIARNPDIIVKTVSGTKFKAYGAASEEPLVQMRNEIMERPGWSEIAAVKNGRVYLLCADLHHDVFGLISEAAYLAKWFYPSLFKDLDPSSIHAHFLEECLGIPYKGIWAYPPPG